MRFSGADVSVVLCAYTEERWNRLAECLEWIRRQTVTPREIILVIDHNADLLARVKQHFPDIIIIENQEAPGVSGSRNTGWAASRGSIVAFMDEDAIAAPDWIEQLLLGYEDPHVLGVGGSIRPRWAAARPGWFPEEFEWVVGCSYKGMPVKQTPIRNLIGANMSFKREVYELFGGFRNGIGRVLGNPIGCEETEFCIRVGQGNPSDVLVYRPEACVAHFVPLKRMRPGYFFNRCYSEGLSKALITHFVGVKDGLASERAYTLNTLPKGVVNGLKETLTLKSWHGLARAGMISAGLLVTTGGYLLGKVKQRS